jgi:hypothetical protein
VNAQDGARLVLMFGVMPLWILAGLADWWCHRRTSIERTSGLRENLFHWLLFAEAGVALLAVAVLEVNAALLLLVLAAFLAHELTTFVELRYTVPRRDVRPMEQMVHSFMEILPLTSIALLAVMAWPQALALAGLGTESADWSLRPKQSPLSASYLVGGFLLSLVFNAVPLAQETWSCLRARTLPSPAPK